MDLSKVLQQLRTDRAQRERQLKDLSEVISNLQKIAGDAGTALSSRFKTQGKTRRRVSKMARKRMAAAQKARWAKVRQQKAA